MRVLAQPHQQELVFQKSRFLGLLVPVQDPDEARAKLKEAKIAYADASHVVHAFRTGVEGSETMGCSDDGEPSGTAGRPVLDVLKGAGGGQCLLLVVRWFGGTKLGTGGLVKAYGDTAKALVQSAHWEERRAWVRAQIAIDFGDLRPLKRELAALGAEVDAESFEKGVELSVRVPEESFPTLQARTVDLTRGRARWTVPSS